MAGLLLLSGLCTGDVRAQCGPTPTPPSGGAQQKPAPVSPVLSAPSPWYELGGQINVTPQGITRFHSPYQGTNSLRSQDELKTSHTYTVYLGARLTPGLEAYLNPEMARGKGISTALGLAGFTNGDVIRNPTLSEKPYWARYFLRWTIPVGHGEDTVDPGENQIAGKRPRHRLVLTAGKLGTNDIFDVSSYADSTRTQFLNWALINNAAYDYAADTRGYSKGAALEWVHPSWALRLGSFQMPTVANGPELATDMTHNRGDQIELEVHPSLLWARHPPTIVRLLGYRNKAHMGKYRDAVDLAKRTGTVPDITAVGRTAAIKYGFGLNFEQALGNEGATGVFGRLGWDDGATESYAYTECDRTLGLGAQLSGAKWHRPQDRLAAALVQDDIVASHRDYLAAGGLGFLLGDGRLRYGPERILEAYYTYQVNRLLSYSLDCQFIRNPGYNKDRGPATVPSLRLHLEF